MVKCARALLGLNKGQDQDQEERERGGLELFQSLALLKPPRVGREKPWHQDHAYFNLPLNQPAASGAPTQVVGAWIAIDEAVPENGCMHVHPGGHKKGGIVHFRRRDWQICDTDILGIGGGESKGDAGEADGSSSMMYSAYAVPMKPGDALFFSSLLPHGTPPNKSDLTRRAIQYHIATRGLVRTTGDDRLAVFGEMGKAVQC